MTAEPEYSSPARPPIVSPWGHLPERECRMVSEFLGTKTHAYQRRHIRVVSSAEMAEYQGLTCLHNHVTVSVDQRLGRRPTDEEMDEVRVIFDMVDAEEDNHQPGRIRNLFLPVHLPRGTVGVCECKEDEEQVLEPDGFTWSKPKAVAT